MGFKHHLYVVGLGLIGGSVARGLSGSEFRITGWDANEESARSALDRGIVEEIYEPGDLGPEVNGAMLAVPVPEMPGVLKQIAAASRPPEFVTDVGSTKEWICKKAAEILPREVEFIGAHPMAGSEKSGLKAADPLLFENAICVLTPVEGTADNFSLISDIWRLLGAHLMELSPRKHDRVVAHISHLPHILAASLIHSVTGVEDYERDALPLAAGGFRDTTRIAAGEPELWKDILETNRREILKGLDNYLENIEDLRKIITSRKWEELVEWLGRAREVRETIPARAKGLIGTLHELRIQAPDRPGILAEVTGILGEAGVNICDIEVLRVREGEKGTIRLAFRRREEFDRARRLLSENAEGISII